MNNKNDEQELFEKLKKLTFGNYIEDPRLGIFMKISEICMMIFACSFIAVALVVFFSFSRWRGIFSVSDSWYTYTIGVLLAASVVSFIAVVVIKFWLARKKIGYIYKGGFWFPGSGLFRKMLDNDEKNIDGLCAHEKHLLERARIQYCCQWRKVDGVVSFLFSKSAAISVLTSAMGVMLGYAFSSNSNLGNVNDWPEGIGIFLIFVLFYLNCVVVYHVNNHLGEDVGETRRQRYNHVVALLECAIRRRSKIEKDMVRNQPVIEAIPIAVEARPAFDGAEHLQNEQDVTEYLRRILADGDIAQLAVALGNVVWARGMIQLAHDAELSCTSLHKNLSGEYIPSSDTLLRVIRAMGCRLSIEPLEAAA